MLPIPARPRTVRAFDVITPTGRVVRYPRPSKFQRIAGWLYANGNMIAVSAAILALVYLAGFAAEALDRLAFNQCNDAAPSGTS